MRYLKKFDNQTAYVAYLNADDIWLPRVSLIVNKGEDHGSVTDPYNDNGPSRVEYSRIGTEFIQVANDGIMYFTDQVYVKDGQEIEYTAAIDGEAIVIKTTNKATGELTDDAYIDEANECIVINYPSGVTETYALPV